MTINSDLVFAKLAPQPVTLTMNGNAHTLRPLTRDELAMLDTLGTPADGETNDQLNARALTFVRSKVIVPIGRRVVITLDAVKASPGTPITIQGELVSLDERWACVRSTDGNATLVAVASITLISTNMTALPRPQRLRAGTVEEHISAGRL